MVPVIWIAGLILTSSQPIHTESLVHQTLRNAECQKGFVKPLPSSNRGSVEYLTHVDYNAWWDCWPLVEACAGSLEELYILAHAAGE